MHCAIPMLNYHITKYYIPKFNLHYNQFGINLLPEMKNLQSITHCQGATGEEFFTTLVAVEGVDELHSNNTENEELMVNVSAETVMK